MPSCNLCEDLYPNALVCQNFDEIPGPPWTAQITSGSTPSVDGDRFVAGGGSLRAEALPFGDAQGGAQYQLRFPSPIERGDIYARVYAYLPSTTSITDWTALVYIEGDTGEKFSLDISSISSVQIDRAGMTSLTLGPNTFPRDRWVCLEFQYRIAEPGVSGIMSVSVDGQLADFLSPAESPAPTGGFTRLQVGARVGPNGGTTVFLDEFVLSTSGPIGCTAALR